MWMRGPVFGRCRTRQMDLLKSVEREVRGTEGKCDMLFWFGWMGGLLEVRRRSGETLMRVGRGRLFGQPVVIDVNAHVTSSLGNTTYFVEILPVTLTTVPASRHGTHNSLPRFPVTFSLPTCFASLTTHIPQGASVARFNRRFAKEVSVRRGRDICGWPLNRTASENCHRRLRVAQFGLSI
jgi:hypothetical protein